MEPGVIDRARALIAGLVLVCVVGTAQEMFVGEALSDDMKSPPMPSEENRDVQSRGTLPPTLLVPQPTIPRVQVPPSPATCPPGYIVNGQFVSKADFQAQSVTASKSKITPQNPVISHVVWNFDEDSLEIVGTRFSQFYCPSPNLPCRNTTPHLFVNQTASLSRPYGANSVIAKMPQRGCQVFVVQRSVAVAQGGNLFTEGPGPESVPYQDFVFIPTRVFLDGVQVLQDTANQPLGYTLIGHVRDSGGAFQGLGKRIADLKILAIAASGQLLADGSQGRVISADSIHYLTDNAITVRDEVVQGDTLQTILIRDPHYGELQSNNIAVTLPRRLLIQEITPSGTGYVITGPNLGNDVNQLRVTENNTPVPQQNLSLQVVTGINTNTTRLTVRNSSVTGRATVTVSTLVPGIMTSLPATVTR